MYIANCNILHYNITDWYNRFVWKPIVITKYSQKTYIIIYDYKIMHSNILNVNC